MGKEHQHHPKLGMAKNPWGDPVKAELYAKRQLKWGALYKRDCRLCKCPLGFGRTFDGKIIPLDLRAPVYCVTGEKSPGEADGVVRTDLAYVSHFATCKYADQFSASHVDPTPIGPDANE